MSTAAAYWGSKRGYAANWYSLCADLICERVTGDPKLPPTIWALKSFTTLPVPHILEIGCLSGDKLAGIVTRGLALKATGHDIAAEAVAVGREKHKGVIDFVDGDLNSPDLPAVTYDVILANGVLHHIAKLEVCCQALYDSLKPGGILIASEFTGPQRYAYSWREIDAINGGVALLPSELQQKFDPGVMAPKLAADPSEAIRTRDIGPVLAATFDRVVYRPYGGNVLMRALSRQFFDKFDPANAEHAAAMARLVAFDTEVSARMPSHHHFFVAHKAIAA